MAHKIKLKKWEREFLGDFIKKGNKKARAIARAHVLLLVDAGLNNKSISLSTKVHRQLIWRTKKRYLAEGLKSALEEKQRLGQPIKYNDKHKAEIIALACTAPPKGRRRWSIQLIVDKIKTRKGLKTINRESVRLILKKTGLSLG